MGLEKLFRTDPENIQQIYQLLSDVVRIFRDNNLKYWSIGGTTLGAVRHGGMFEWDDDADLGIWKKDVSKFLSLRKDFKKCGYSIAKVWFGYKVYRTDIKPEPGLNYSYPFVDIFPFVKRGKMAMYESVDARETWPKETLYVKEIKNAKLMKFGDLEIWVPSRPKAILTRHFGADWNDVAYREYDHTKEESMTPFRVKLTDKDRKPALPKRALNKKACLGSAGLNPNVNKIAKKFPIVKEISPNCSRDRECISIGMPVYVINCEFSKLRLNTFEQDAKREGLNVCREPCVDGRKFNENIIYKMIRGGVIKNTADVNPIEFAIFLSHYNCWTRIIDSCEPYGLIMEDDLRLRKGFLSKLDKCIQSLKNESIDFDILYLWDGNWASTRKRKTSVPEVFQHTKPYNAGGVAYILSSRFAKILANKAFPIKDPVDIYIGDYALSTTGTIALALETKPRGETVWKESSFISVKLGGEVGTGNTTQNYDMSPISRKKY